METFDIILFILLMGYMLINESDKKDQEEIDRFLEVKINRLETMIEEILNEKE